MALLSTGRKNRCGGFLFLRFRKGFIQCMWYMHE